MKKLLALLLCISILAVGLCACADNEGPDAGSESVTETQQNEDTSKDDTGNNDPQNPDGEKETIKEPEGTASSDPEGDGYWTPNY